MKLKGKVVLELKSPMLVGGKRTNNNYIKSLNYIPGSVLRAAISREITMSCPYYDHNTSKKKYWVSYKNDSYCKECRFKNLCKNFSEINIGHCYPFNGKVYPLTAIRCKEHSEHEVKDILIEKIKREIASIDKKINPFLCLHQKCGQRTERCDGLYYEKDKKVRDIQVVYSLTTKNSINPYLRTSKDEVLYNLDALTNIAYIDESKQTLQMEGIIEGEGIEDLKHLDTLYIGAYVTSGFGEVEIDFSILKWKEHFREIETRVDEFNKRIEYGKDYFVPITLMTDGYFNLEDKIDKPLYDISSEEYIGIYHDLLKKYIPMEFNIDNIIAYNEIRRGFDTSNKNTRLRRPKVVTKAGSIFILSINKNDVDFKKLSYMEEKGIGENTAHGFGRISIADNFHIEHSYIGGDLHEK